MQNNCSFSDYFCSTVKETIHQYGLAKNGAKITVALSGGADSVALLLSLLRQKDYCFTVSACHLNHGIRSVTAKRDEDFAKQLCEKLSVPFYSETVDIPKLCETEKGSVETIARNERYAFFRRASRHFGNSLIATAHTMSDNAETVLFNIVRGTSTDGVCGIPPKRDIFIRPLIKLKRADIEAFLSENAQSFMTDETNSDEEYSRNFIRLNIVPKLKELNCSFEEAVFRLSESARTDRKYFDEKISSIKDPDVKELSTLPYSILSRYVRALVEKSDSGIRLSSERLEAIADATFAVSQDGETRFISLPHKKRAVVSNNGITIENILQEKKESHTFNIPLVNGKNIINDAYAVFITEEYADEKKDTPEVIKNEDIVYRLYINFEIQSAIMSKGLFARQRLEGDSFRIGGMSRKLKKVYSEQRININERDLLPVICDADGNIIATPCFTAPCDSAKCEISDKKITLAFYRSL